MSSGGGENCVWLLWMELSLVEKEKRWKRKRKER
jgi:hypothetical protein